LKYLILLIVALNIYALTPDKLYEKGELEKAKEVFLKYSADNSVVAKAYLAKIYYKEGNYKEAEKYINEVLNSNAPDKVKNELKTYLLHINGVKWINVELSAGLLYDSNVNFAKKKDDRKSDLAHIEEAFIEGYYLKNNFSVEGQFKIQNRGYIQYSDYNNIFIDAKGKGVYYNYINTELDLGFETNTLGSNSLYKGRLQFFKNISRFSPGVFLLGEYYENDDYNTLNVGGGLRLGFKTENSNTIVSLYSYNSLANDSDYDNMNYKADVKWYWHFSKVYLYVNYYYNISSFDDYRINMHYFDISFNSKESKHFYYSMGMTDYYSLSNKTEEELRKYEIYAKFIYSF